MNVQSFLFRRAWAAGSDLALNCAGNCWAKFTDGTVVTLTAVPPDGKTFVNWSGACSGQAVFSK